MPITSYLAYPVEGQSQQLMSELEAHPYCEVLPAQNAELFVLVTDTPDRAQEVQTQAYLHAHESLACLALVYGEIEQEQEEHEGA